MIFLCENCNKKFDRKTDGRFCSRNCWYKFNAKNLVSLNDKGFQWVKATDEEKKQRIRERFEKNIIKTECCWEWKGYKDKNGYGLLGSGANGGGFKERRAHRIAWYLEYGDIPEGKILAHHCDNPSCVRIDHIFLTDHQGNSDDKLKKNRGNKGEKHGNSKLDKEKVIEIRKLLKSGVSQYEIARKFNIGVMAISSIKFNRTWGHIEEERIEKPEEISDCRIGSKHKCSKLSELKVLEIKKSLKNGSRQDFLAKKYEVSNVQISRINTGKSWKHVTISP